MEYNGQNQPHIYWLVILNKDNRNLHQVKEIPFNMRCWEVIAMCIMNDPQILFSLFLKISFSISGIFLQFLLCV